jgi:hypothetical protein
MGTSNAFGGPGNNTPLVPTWLEPEAPISPEVPGSSHPEVGEQGDGERPEPSLPLIPPLAVPPLPTPNRFQVARTNLTRFVGSNGSDVASLGRAVSHYISKSSGGARQAARRMGSSRKSGKRLLGFLSDAIARGAQEALQELHLESLAGLPIQDVFLGLIDYICPDGGTIDEGIARDAFIETIADLAKNGITDLDSLSSDQMQTVFEIYLTHTILNRLYNDIGTKAIQLPLDARMAIRIQVQIQDFIRRGVADVLHSARKEMRALTQDTVQGFVDHIYENVFLILVSLGNEEATKL